VPFQRATEVPAASELTEEQLRRQRISNAVQGRVAKRQALRRAGADIEPSSDDLAGRLEHRLHKIDQKVGGKSNQAKARAAVSSRMKGKP
jgi:hypothetical protein